MQIEKFLENIKRANQKKKVCRGNIFSKLINVQTKIRLFTKDKIDMQGIVLKYRIVFY